MNKQDLAKKLTIKLNNLKRSPLYKYRIANNYMPVLGAGNLDSKIVFIGEAPGKNEAISGKPFVGAAGKILDKMLNSIELKREDIYITNLVNDRPPENRDPSIKEIKIYMPILEELLSIINPRVIATLGRFSMQVILNNLGIEKPGTISEMHGKPLEFHSENETIIVIPLYHPAATIYNQKLRPQLEEDFKTLKKYINK